eukprot:COSAG04_NODE_2327_length_4330_cov_13.235405_4_plen_69_part_00
MLSVSLTQKVSLFQASPEEILHINRYHDTPWAPVEVDCARRIMAEVSPRLVIDLHEHDVRAETVGLGR